MFKVLWLSPLLPLPATTLFPYWRRWILFVLVVLSLCLPFSLSLTLMGLLLTGPSAGPPQHRNRRFLIPLFVVLVVKSCLTLLWLWIVAHQAPLSMRFPRPEHWSGLPFPSPGDLPAPGIEPESLALAGRFLTTEPLAHPQKPERCLSSSFWSADGGLHWLSRLHFFSSLLFIQ